MAFRAVPDGTARGIRRAKLALGLRPARRAMGRRAFSARHTGAFCKAVGPQAIEWSLQLSRRREVVGATGLGVGPQAID